MMFCQKCGTKLPDDATFCVKCGSKLYHVEEAEEKVAEPVKAVEPAPVQVVAPEPPKPVEPAPVQAVEPEPPRVVAPNAPRPAPPNAPQPAARKKKKEDVYSLLRENKGSCPAVRNVGMSKDGDVEVQGRSASYIVEKPWKYEDGVVSVSGKPKLQIVAYLIILVTVANYLSFLPLKKFFDPKFQSSFEKFLLVLGVSMLLGGLVGLIGVLMAQFESGVVTSFIREVLRPKKWHWEGYRMQYIIWGTAITLGLVFILV